MIFKLYYVYDIIIIINIMPRDDHFNMLFIIYLKIHIIIFEVDLFTYCFIQNRMGKSDNNGFLVLFARNKF